MCTRRRAVQRAGAAHGRNAHLRGLLSVDGRFPSRRTWERRLPAIPTTLPGQIGCLGRALVALLQPWAGGRAAAIDSTVLRARGGVWHKKDRDAGTVPHTSIDTEAHWTKSGWHGWVYGWKLHLVVTVAAVWIPLAAELTPANVADNVQALACCGNCRRGALRLRGSARQRSSYRLGLCWRGMDRGRDPTGALSAYRRGCGGAPHLARAALARAIENLNEPFKGIFDARRPGADQGAGQHPPLCPGRRVRLSAQPVVPARAQALSLPRRLETVSQGGLSH